MRIDDACHDYFARHETFHPRWGWIRKAHAEATISPRIFNQEDATLTLGVGKNMVRAIRYWGHAFRALADRSDPDRPRMGLSEPSVIGDALFGPSGWDPFMEDVGTLWALHWWLLAPPSHVPVWWIAFAEFGAVEFAQAQLTDFVHDQLDSVSAWTKPHPSSIEKDLSCLLRTYSPAADTGRRQPFDDLVDCPMRELGLIRCIDASERRFRFATGPKPTLPPEVVLFACADFLARTEAKSRTAMVSRLATEPGAPGRMYRLSETDLVSAIEAAAASTGLIQLARPAGVVQFTFDIEPAVLATKALRAYYSRRRLGAGPPEGAVVGGLGADRASASAVPK